MGGLLRGGTHLIRPDNQWPEYYSYDDWNWLNIKGKPLYLGTPDGYIKLRKPGQKRLEPEQIHP